MNVVLVGIKHAGKSSIGAAVAEEHDLLFVDSDELIETNYMLVNGEKLSCREIFHKVGREAFRQLETEAIKQLIESTNEDDQSRVISVGGGVADNPGVTAEMLKQLGLVVFINVDIEFAWERVIANGVPAYLEQESDPAAIFAEMSRKRIEFYAGNADVTVDVGGADVAECADMLSKKLEGYLL